MTATPAALQLRLLQTVVEVAAEKNSTLVLPFPVELLRFLERATPSTTEHPGDAAASKPAAVVAAALSTPADPDIAKTRITEPTTHNGAGTDR